MKRAAVYLVVGAIALSLGAAVWDRFVAGPKIRELGELLRRQGVESAQAERIAREWESRYAQLSESAAATLEKHATEREESREREKSLSEQARRLRDEIGELRQNLVRSPEPMPEYRDPQLAGVIAVGLQELFSLTFRPAVYEDLRLSRQAAELVARAVAEAGRLGVVAERLSELVETQQEQIGELRGQVGLLEEEVSTLEALNRSQGQVLEKWKEAYHARVLELETARELIREHEKARRFRWLPRLGCSVGPSVSGRGAGVVGTTCGPVWLLP